jgi:hypothetical protein
MTTKPSSTRSGSANTVFIPKSRRNILYRTLRQYLGGVFCWLDRYVLPFCDMREEGVEGLIDAMHLKSDHEAYFLKVLYVRITVEIDE